MATINILIADDHPIVRRGLEYIAQNARDINVCGEAENGFSALEKVREADPDVLVLDMAMPDISGMDVLKQLRSEGNTVPVLILSGGQEEQYAVRALKAGASGYLSKESVETELIKAIRSVGSGRKYIGLKTAERIAESFSSTEGENPHSYLSDRELDVMLQLARGFKIREIAAKLNLSSTTVSTYRSRLLKKMDASSNAELTLYAIRHRLL
ncbi:DNA-binding response regulator [Marispirochaeta aestuarii]|uniref:DNA-binding response regulator n=1 Tax=Marispirochaeta aestuarii TaxID=1963862 RepID=A0A1Y1RZ88_9SPIO|nr:response regulator transcription factor [Marispirochaeta aestuarii]ORC35156.1 DNA-binding response regulator [Marispirochaeta aestuarii]